MSGCSRFRAALCWGEVCAWLPCWLLSEALSWGCLGGRMLVSLRLSKRKALQRLSSCPGSPLGICSKAGSPLLEPQLSGLLPGFVSHGVPDQHVPDGVPRVSAILTPCSPNSRDPAGVQVTISALSPAPDSSRVGQWWKLCCSPQTSVLGAPGCAAWGPGPRLERGLGPRRLVAGAGSQCVQARPEHRGAGGSCSCSPSPGPAAAGPLGPGMAHSPGGFLSQEAPCK